MSKSPKKTGNPKGAREAATGRFIGRAKDGTRIARPDFKPRSFTVDKLRRVIRDVRREEADAKAG